MNSDPDDSIAISECIAGCPTPLGGKNYYSVPCLSVDSCI